jgi:hypothetical protein
MLVQPAHVITNNFTCAWGDEFQVGDLVIVGIYYHKWGHGEHNYVFLGYSQVAYIYVHLILACKFAMLPCHHRVKGDKLVYKLPNEVLHVIKSCLEA